MAAEEKTFLAATPHGELEKIFDDMYIVSGSFDMGKCDFFILLAKE